MSVVDKIVAAITPPETEEQRLEARARARVVAASCDWLAMVLDHHQQIERAFETARQAKGGDARRTAHKALSGLLTGHAVAEEAVIYPHMALHDQKAHATMAYAEQSAATMELGMLEALDPNGHDWLDKLEHIRGAVQHHMYQEEGTWFPELARCAPTEHNQMITMRYTEEFERYAHGERHGGMETGGMDQSAMIMGAGPGSDGFIAGEAGSRSTGPLTEEPLIGTTTERNTGLLGGGGL